MKNIINKIKEKDNLPAFILFFLISLGISLNIYLESSDEIWNFQNVYKMYNGFKIYKEINVIITPFFFWISEAIFHILGANLCIFRISHCIFMSILFLITYEMLKKLEISKTFSMLTVLMIILQQFFLLIRTSFNYNNTALLFFIIGTYCLINDKTRKNILIQSIITSLILLTKQNIGLYYLLGNILYLSISKNDIKNKIKEIFKYISIIFLVGMIFIIYLIIDHNLNNFLNYTLGGIFEFANENLIFDSSAIVLMIGIMIVNIGMSIFFIKKNFLLKEQKENIKILFIFSIMLSLVCYPIFNWTHIIIGTYLMIINVVYMVYLLFKDFKDGITKILKVVNGMIILAMIIFSCLNMYTWIKAITSDDYPYSWENPFFGGMLGKEEYEENEKIIKYIEENEKDVIVLSNRAALYMVPLKRNNGDFDLPFKGNFGINGVDGLIEKIDNMQNVQFLIYKNEDKSIYQESDRVKEHIKNTKSYVGEIEGFDIYE